MMNRRRRSLARKQHGFLLIVLLALIAMGVLYAVTSALTGIDFKNARSSATGGLLKQSRDVLLAYAVTYPDFPTQNAHPNATVGYLPCPDLDGNGSADALDVDCGGTDGKVVIGLLPYKELGLPSNVDADGNCLWYAVSGTFKASSNKPSPMNWDTQGQFEIRDSGDTLLATPNDANGGAAAVVFAVGPFLSGQNRSTVSSTSPCGVSATNKADVVYANFIDVDPTKASRVLSEPIPPVLGTTVRLVQGSADNAVNNDRLVWITPKEIFDRVRKRSDVATLLDANLNALINDLHSKLTGNPSAHANGVDFALPAQSYTPGSILATYYNNYSDHFRFRRCAIANDYCFLVNGLYCDGVLLFGGLADGTTNGTSSPRPSDKRTYPYYLESTDNGGLSLLAAANPTGAYPAAITGTAAQSFSSAAPSQDIVQCLKPQVVQIDSSQMFQSSNPALSGKGLVAASGSTLTLGTTNIGGANTPYYGCLWLPTPIPFGSGIRTYFEYVVTSRSEGFTFALADADPARNASTSMCGAAADALSYAGNNGTTSPINFPKMALELDMRRSNFFPPSGFPRNDPASSPSMHFGIDYWGTTATVDDDVTHGAGNGSAAEPTNPAGTPGLRQFLSSVSNGTTVFVRLDITRSYSGVTQTGAYDVKAFIIQATLASWALGTTYFPNSITCSPGVPLVPGDLKQHLDEDLAARCPSLLTSASNYLRYLNSSVNIADVGGAGEAMRRIYMGFTTGQNSSQMQTITIGNFQSTTR